LANPYISYYGGESDPDPLAEYPVMLGRDIANHKEMAAVIHSALDDLTSFTLLGVDMQAARHFSITDTAFRLMVDGSAVMLNPPGFTDKMPPAWLEDVYVASPTLFYRYHRQPDGAMTLVAPQLDLDKIYSIPSMSEWVLTEGGWKETVYTYQRGADRTAASGQTVPAAGLAVFPNGRGPVYWAQRLAMRIAELEETERFVNHGPNVLPIITGNVGPVDKARSAIKNAVRAIFFPGRVEVNRPISNDTVGQILKVLGDKREQLLAALNAMEQDTPDRPVASDRELRMRSMVLYCERVRSELKKVYALFGETLEFSPIIVQTAQDRMIELQIGDAVQPKDWPTRRQKLVGY
jgi:hypothetical protein